jgi:hypothetical protein
LGKTLTEQSREVFNSKTLDEPENAFASTGFNHRKISKVDQQLHANSRRYGTETQLRSASNHQPIDYFTTTNRSSFFSPVTLHRPNWRQRDNSVKFDDSRTLALKQVTSDKLASGYSANR